MSEDISLEEYQKAYRKIVLKEEKKGFLGHLALYIIVNIVLIVINLFFVSDVLWFFQPPLLLGWGFGLVMHYLFGVRWKKEELMEKEAKTEKLVKS